MAELEKSANVDSAAPPAFYTRPHERTRPTTMASSRRRCSVSEPPPPVYAPADAPAFDGAPRICVSPIDTLLVVLSHSVLVEISVNKNMRLCHLGSVAVAMAGGGRIAAIHHPVAEVIQEEADIYADTNDGSRLRFSRDAVRLLPSRRRARQQSMWTLSEGGGLRHEPAAADARFPPLPVGHDQTETAFLYEPSGNLLGFWPTKRDRCADIASRATLYADWNERQSLALDVHGVHIRQDLRTGDVRVNQRRICLQLRPADRTVVARSPWVDMAVDRRSQLRLHRADQFGQVTPQCLTIGCGRDLRADFDVGGELVSRTFQSALHYRQ